MPKANPKPSWDDLNDAQRTRLKAFKTSNGRSWKQKLADHWWSGTDANLPDGHLLRQIRNQFGPQWLDKLPEE